jgi:hypothetical protein
VRAKFKRFFVIFIFSFLSSAPFACAETLSPLERLLITIKGTKLVGNFDGEKCGFEVTRNAEGDYILSSLVTNENGELEVLGSISSKYIDDDLSIIEKLSGFGDRGYAKLSHDIYNQEYFETAEDRSSVNSIFFDHVLIDFDTYKKINSVQFQVDPRLNKLGLPEFSECFFD